MRVALIACAACVAIGCGAAASAPGGSEPGQTSLRISFWADGNDEAKASDKPAQWTLRCDPAAGSHPQDAEACRKLKALKQPFKAPRKDVQCTEQYGGPEEAVITGTYLGNRVFAKLARTNGCQISRFKRLAFLIPGFRASSPGS